METGNPIVHQLNRNRMRINRMLSVKHLGDSSGSGQKDDGFVRRLSAGERFTLAARKMRALNPEGFGSLQGEKLRQVGRDISEKFSGGQSLLHLTPASLDMPSFWTEMETVLAGQSGTEPAPTQPGTMRRGTVIQKHEMFPKQGQPISEFKRQASQIPAQPKPKPPARRPAPDPRSRLFSKVEEITPKQQPSEQPDEDIAVELPDDVQLQQKPDEITRPTLDQPPGPPAPKTRPIPPPPSEPVTRPVTPTSEEQVPQKSLPKSIETEPVQPEKPAESPEAPKTEDGPAKKTSSSGPPTVQRLPAKKAVSKLPVARPVKKKVQSKGDLPLAKQTKTKPALPAEDIQDQPPVPEPAEEIEIADFQEQPDVSPLRDQIEMRKQAPKALPVIQPEKPRPAMRLRRTPLTTSHPKASGLQIQGPTAAPPKEIQRKPDVQLPEVIDRGGLRLPRPEAVTYSKPIQTEVPKSAEEPRRTPQSPPPPPMVMARHPKGSAPTQISTPQPPERAVRPQPPPREPARQSARQSEKPRPVQRSLTRPTVQRVMDLTPGGLEQAGRGLMGQSSSPDQMQSSQSEAQQPPKQDLEALAREIFPLIKRLIEIEVERTSGIF